MMVFNQLIEKKKKLAVIGLGYVGMPLAVEFAKKILVIGFDINDNKIALYKKGIDPTGEVGNEEIKKSTIDFTNDENMLKDATFFVVAVPTPINQDKTPDLSPVIGASEVVGRNISKGAVIVYESTVYPGVTESVCIPIIEKISGLKCGLDWKIGYSPERINPADKVHRVWNIKKIVSGCDAESLEDIADVYSLIIEAGVHKAPSIKVAEAAKVVENSQRDINIAFMNELAMVFDKMNIDTKDVVDAMNTKWNALGFVPGLVGGHCIGVDPYYFVYEAEKLGYHSQIILSGRKVNDDMGIYISNVIVRELTKAKIDASSAKILILGATFKENCPDVRNSKVFDIYNGLKGYGINAFVFDPICNKDEVEKEYNVTLCSDKDLNSYDCVVLAVAHDVFKTLMIDNLFKKNIPNNRKIIIDIKSMFDKTSLLNKGYKVWRL
ncbi:MAG: nucleotide sugar dehydrogenase [Clostridia bacterium]|nr:nucleotide sugar dehydrogenase [Clostridia bacterium]